MNHCRRCQGLLVWSEFRDHERVFLGARCVNCGDLFDSMLLYNRAHPPAVGWNLAPGSVMGCRGFRYKYGEESNYDARH